MHRFAIAIPALVAVATATVASADVFSDDFEGFVNNGGWSFTSSPGLILPTGGNPDHYLWSDRIDTFAPMARTDQDNGTPLEGDYRENQVSALRFDALTSYTDFNTAGNPIAVLLRDTKGTPGVDDDDYAYFVGPAAPVMDGGWLSYDIEIPSQNTDAVPAGWSGGWVGDGENFRPGIDWNDVITSVDVVEIWWFHPAWFGIFQQWEVGLDNVELEYVPGSTPTLESTWGSVKAAFSN